MPGVVTTSHEERIARFERIRASRDDGKSLTEIGELFDPPLTKQRVASILRSGPPKPIGPPRRKVATP
jgi:hypothetical protein